ncbi:MAG: YvcK family protein [Candidatus Doudnabacteria bacterium]|nr:YvcK family protein [Candidatus Doudnabacteria bacterium]
MKNVVIIGGGTGTFTLLSGLRKFPVNNTVIVSSADSGGSTGVLRKDLGVFPPGDLRQCLLGLAYIDQQTADLFAYRFEQGFLRGHVVGNILLAALEKTTGNIESAVEMASKMLNVRGAVLPVSLKPATLIATLENGKKIVGEHNIDEPKQKQELRIKNLELRPSASANPRVLQALKEADAIIFGPGDLYTSTLPNLLIKGIKETIQKSNAVKVVITNLMTKLGQTDKFKASDFVKVLGGYLGARLDAAIVNTKRPEAKILRSYKKERSDFVEPDIDEIKALSVKVLAANLVSKQIFQKSKSDSLKRSVLRHDADKIAKIIWKLIA